MNRYKKKKEPAATLIAPGDKKDLQTQYITTQGGFTT
nr:MAG TPA: hypothetical protein [Caudoviricetes sp.]